MESIRPMELTLENERRFLVKRMSQGCWRNGGKEITQWYICFDPPIRVRVENFDDCFLTIKTENEPGKDYHLEGGIPELALPGLATARKGNKIRKTRYPMHNVELDVFRGQLEGLALIEFEKKSEGDVPKIPLDFSVVEVTGDPRFRNYNLAQMDRIPKEWKYKLDS